MPKTKLGCEIKNYGYKKAKTSSSICSFTASIDKSDLKTKVKDILQSEKINSEKVENITVINSPFKCISIEDFLDNNDFVIQLKSECENLKFNQKNNDLYKFQQSSALSGSSGDLVCQLRSKLLEILRPWIMDVLDLELEADNLDLFCAKYLHTDTLLCHDDELEGRKVAFILYLSEDHWTEKDGGLLELFDTDDGGNPKEVVKKLVPHNNSFAFFEVSPVSFHQVSEVLNETKTRMSLSGWFRGKSKPNPPRAILPPAPLLSSIELDEDQFFSWINPSYLDPQTQGDIQSQFEESSEISLSQFLPPELYSQVCLALEQHQHWSTVGPPDRKCYDSMQEEVPEIIKSCLQFFTSDAFYLLLSNLTGLRLHQLAPEDSDDEEDDKDKVYNPRCRGGISRWSRGCYTLIRDDDQEQAEYALDLRMFFNVSSAVVDGEAGGQTVYIARGEDEELVTVMPEENTLSLVYRDKESLKFIKYVNSRLDNSFHDLFITYYE